MSDHTKGPWRADTHGIRDIGGYICALTWPHRYEGQDARFEEETARRAADARLISAAPDLLAALKALVGQRNSKELAMAHDMARNAIAKAEVHSLVKVAGIIDNETEAPVSVLRDCMEKIMPGERLDLMSLLMDGYCKGCGNEDPGGRCKCWNDE